MNMNWVRWLASWFGFRFVILIDYDSSERIRLVRSRLSGQLYAKRHGFNIRNVVLAPDGTCPDGLYVKRWKPIWLDHFNISHPYLERPVVMKPPTSQGGSKPSND